MTVKVLALWTTGKVSIQIDGEEYIAEITHPAFSTEHQTALADMRNDLQSDGASEIFIEEHPHISFIHKIINGKNHESDNVNSYPVFANLRAYADDLKNYRETVDELPDSEE